MSASVSITVSCPDMAAALEIGRFAAGYLETMPDHELTYLSVHDQTEPPF